MLEIHHCHYCSGDAHANISALFLIKKFIVLFHWGKRQLCVHMYCTLNCVVVSTVAWVLTPLLCCLAMW